MRSPIPILRKTCMDSNLGCGCLSGDPLRLRASFIRSQVKCFSQPSRDTSASMNPSPKNSYTMRTSRSSMRESS